MTSLQSQTDTPLVFLGVLHKELKILLYASRNILFEFIKKLYNSDKKLKFTFSQTKLFFCSISFSIENLELASFFGFAPFDETFYNVSFKFKRLGT